MATYKFKNTSTDEIFEIEMSITAIDNYKLLNPHLKQLITGFQCVSSLESNNNIPAGFRDLLGNIHRNTPGSTLGEHH